MARDDKIKKKKLSKITAFGLQKPLNGEHRKMKF